MIHPLARRHNPWFVLVDGLFHALNEQNPQESLVKFLKYDGKMLLEAVMYELDRWTRES